MKIKNFRLGFKRGIVKKKIKKVLKYSIFQFHRKEVKSILKDVRYYNEDLCDFIINYDFKGVSGLKEAINSWLHLESQMTGFNRSYYKVGDGKILFKVIELQKEVWHENRIQENK